MTGGSLRSYLAEALGTFAIVLVAGGAACAEALSGGRLGGAGAALAYGLAVSAMTFAYRGTSGAHFNPAITTALLLTRRLDGARGVFYVLSQLLGATAGALLLRTALHAHPEAALRPPFLGACALSEGVGFKLGTLLEAVATFYLVAVFMSAPPDSPTVPAALAAGAVVTAMSLALGPFTGAALNPARAFGPAVAAGRWQNWFVYWTGPIVGAAAAALLHEYLVPEPAKK